MLGSANPLTRECRSNDSKGSHFQGRSKSQANAVGLDDLLKLPGRSHRPERATTNALISPKEGPQRRQERPSASSMTHVEERK